MDAFVLCHFHVKRMGLRRITTNENKFEVTDMKEVVSYAVDPPLAGIGIGEGKGWCAVYGFDTYVLKPLIDAEDGGVDATLRYDCCAVEFGLHTFIEHASCIVWVDFRVKAATSSFVAEEGGYICT